MDQMVGQYTTFTTRVRSKYRIYIPANVLRMLELEQGDYVQVTIRVKRRNPEAS